MCFDNHENLYVAGWLTDSIGNTRVAKWDGTSWTYVGYGSSVLNGYVEIQTMIADSMGNIYIGGSVMDSTYFVAKWDGASWTRLGTSLSPRNQVLSLCLDPAGNLYAAGVLPDSTGHRFVSKWNGTSWTKLGIGTHALNPNSVINVLCSDAAGNIYAAGNFTDGPTDTSGYLYVAKWDGSNWTELGTGVCHAFEGWNAQIYSLAIDHSGNIYAGGWVSRDSDFVSKWDGVSWTKLGTSTNRLPNNSAVYTMCLDKFDNLLVGGTFIDSATGSNMVAKWDGITWSELGSGTGSLYANVEIFSIIKDKTGNIYAGGMFRDTSITYHMGGGNPDRHPVYVAKFTDPATGISSEPTLFGLSFNPNPTHDAINISGVNETLNYQLITISGSKVSEGTLQPGTNNLSMIGLASGVYLLNVTNAAGNKNTVRMVKE